MANGSFNAVHENAAGELSTRVCACALILCLGLSAASWAITARMESPSEKPSDHALSEAYPYAYRRPNASPLVTRAPTTPSRSSPIRPMPAAARPASNNGEFAYIRNDETLGSAAPFASEGEFAYIRNDETLGSTGPAHHHQETAPAFNVPANLAETMPEAPRVATAAGVQEGFSAEYPTTSAPDIKRLRPAWQQDNLAKRFTVSSLRDSNAPAESKLPFFKQNGDSVAALFPLLPPRNLNTMPATPRMAQPDRPFLPNAHWSPDHVGPIPESTPFAGRQSLVPPPIHGNFYPADATATNRVVPNTEASDQTAPKGTASNRAPDTEESPSFYQWPNPCENAPFDSRAFTSNPSYQCLPYDPGRELSPYESKYCVPAQTPWVEMFRGLYRPGELPPANTFLTGETNPTIPHFLVFGDYRTAIAINDNGDDRDEVGVWAHRLNLDFDLKITSTERLHAFWGPLDEDGRFTRAEFDDDNIELIEELDDDFDTFYLEGDMGYIWGGMTDRWAPFDLPFVAGKYPLLFQNGIWMVDAIEGFAFTIPARHSRLLRWSNFDATVFFAFDDIDSPAFQGDDNAARAYGTNWFIEAMEGYFEVGYAYLEDTTDLNRDYHNFAFAFTRRYLQRISNSVRVIVNAGQDPAVGEQTADGQLILIENSWISSNPSNFVPYLNLFAGFDRPQSVARTGGILLNTGIHFESDGLTGFPTLDATGNNTWGGALGINLLGPDFAWQLITEVSTVQTFKQGGQRAAVDDEYGIGARFQIPLSNSWLARLDGMYGIRENATNVNGARIEMRWKF